MSNARIARLQAGGTTFEIPFATLNAVPGNRLLPHVQQNTRPDGSCFVDVDFKVFSYVLDFLRSRADPHRRFIPPSNPDMLARVNFELQHWGLDQTVSRRLAPPKGAHRESSSAETLPQLSTAPQNIQLTRGTLIIAKGKKLIAYVPHPDPTETSFVRISIPETPIPLHQRSCYLASMGTATSIICFNQEDAVWGFRLGSHLWDQLPSIPSPPNGTVGIFFHASTFYALVPEFKRRSQMTGQYLSGHSLWSVSMQSFSAGWASLSAISHCGSDFNELMGRYEVEPVGMTPSGKLCFRECICPSRLRSSRWADVCFADVSTRQVTHRRVFDKTPDYGMYNPSTEWVQAATFSRGPNGVPYVIGGDYVFGNGTVYASNQLVPMSRNIYERTATRMVFFNGAFVFFGGSVPGTNSPCRVVEVFRNGSWGQQSGPVYSELSTVNDDAEVFVL
ncbi:hypothetical protein BKA69DRAFT_1045657 [Paraphysoderma sedebokerense]|nr:hypothetical protein BKA69DRAFT_1045657 [Paraphysoderma sedebokerense]